jgi:hypothetical protein
VGIDVAKDIHWVCAIDNTQDALDALAIDLKRLGEVTVGLDVAGSIATFLEAVLLAEGLALVHVPGIAVNRAGQGSPGASASPIRATPASSPSWCARDRLAANRDG